jgi:hypothetical protein
MRKVIVHKHLFKNAGTTFDSILKENYGNGFCDHREDDLMRKFGQNYLVNYLYDNENIKALSSHHIWFKLQPVDSIQLIPVYFLRHPIERIMSVYNFEKIQPESTPGSIMAKKLDFIGYVKWRLEDEVSPVIRDFQTRYIAGTMSIDSLNEKIFEDAENEVLKNPFVGIVDRFDESMAIFEKEFKKIGIHINCRNYKAQNVLQQIDDIDIDRRCNDILKMLNDIADNVISKNNYDLRLYNLARERLSAL